MILSIKDDVPLLDNELPAFMKTCCSYASDLLISITEDNNGWIDQSQMADAAMGDLKIEPSTCLLRIRSRLIR